MLYLLHIRGGSNMQLHEKIKLLRKIHGFSQQDLANQFNISRQSIQKWESGETAPDIFKLKDLSKIFSISLDILLDDNLTEEKFRVSVLHRLNGTPDETTNVSILLNQATKLDYSILYFTLGSTTLFVVVLHILGITLVLINFLIIITGCASGIYFILNSIYYINNGISFFLINLSFSLMGFSISSFLSYSFIRAINGYVAFTKVFISRLKYYDKIIKELKTYETH